MNVLNTTLGFVLCCQSPALFLAAVVLLICYFARKKNHRVRAVFDLILAILCAVGGVALYFLGMGWEYFTIRDFLVIRPIGWVGLGIVAVITIVAAVREGSIAPSRHQSFVSLYEVLKKKPEWQ